MIRYTTSADGIVPEMLAGFFVGWADPPTAQTHLKILRRSSHVVVAIDEGTGRVVGFISAISDGVLCAHITLLEVLPDYQRRGIGTELTRRMLGELGDLYAVDAACDAELSGFYARCGMQERRAMVLRNYRRQSGLGARPGYPSDG
jgi:ribosomal protein S18 acetylase RimI-like enzyme